MAPVPQVSFSEATEHLENNLRGIKSALEGLKDLRAKQQPIANTGAFGVFMSPNTLKTGEALTQVQGLVGGVQRVLLKEADPRSYAAETAEQSTVSQHLAAPAA